MNSSTALYLPWWKSVFSVEYWKNLRFGSTNLVDAYSGRQTNLPSDAYKVVNIDQSAASPQYYGYVTPDAGTPTTNYGWYIMKAVISGNITTYTFATWDNGTGAAVGLNGVQYRTASTGAWANRANLTYADYETVL